MPDPLPDGEIEDEADEVRQANTVEETLPNETVSVLLPVPTSALATVRPIEDLNRISYPEGIKNPKAELNVNAQKGRYDRDFLLQFMNICKEKPDNLLLLDVIGKRPGPRNLQTTISGVSAPTFPSALRTARHIEDINRISYPEGIESSKIQLDVNTQEGKFRYVPSVFDFPFKLNTFSCRMECGYCLSCSN
ncbi:eukaryotic translation initiation factor 4G1, eIF4E-binding domain-containing protein [Lactarius akahatsu]|uniref:Eukaryotic translation initiation factor 4G1, eIF4E-binding domain-containing protein n=1 Tax=Lactarius akahatsu TaxID=416441 RepID=A0AAD4LS01_9AGAM|nr:eukaryotic translation initiation factor 4G1, eIF4E-binding domain-containing protein [Lactarius akahatsu]